MVCLRNVPSATAAVKSRFVTAMTRIDLDPFSPPHALEFPLLEDPQPSSVAVQARQ